MEFLIESEMKNIDLESPQGAGDSSQDQMFESQKGRSIIDMVYGEGDFEIEDNDEETLLPHQVPSDERDSSS